MNGIPAFLEDQSLILIGINYDHVPINKAESENDEMAPDFFKDRSGRIPKNTRFPVES